MDKHITKMTAQEVFDHGAKHLLTQNKKSINKNGECAYIGPNGLKCAVGIFISEDEYNIDMEGVDLEGLISNSFLENWDFLFEADKKSITKSRVLSELQSIHDETPERLWKQGLSEVAEDLKLNKKALEDVYPES